MNVDKAVAYHKQHPSEHIKDVLKHFTVPKSTFYDHLNGTHSARGVNTTRNLSLQQEAALIGKINDFAGRGTLLAPRHIRELANRFADEPVGKNWPSTFISRHREDISSKFFRFQEIARLEADTPLKRAAFHELVKSAYDDYFYPSHNIYNMDETGFTLSNEFNERGVGLKQSTSKSKGALPKDTHITVVAAISTSDSPVPPYLIYPGQHFIEEWTTPRDDEPKMMGAVSNSGYINSYLMMRWLEDCFDPYTRSRAGQDRRLLFLDGLDTHVRVDFLEACWDKKIVCMILPAHLTAIFQPLDVDFFFHLKRSYSQLVYDYQIDSQATRLAKAYFYRFLQRSWKDTAISRRIRSAWAKTGLFPLNQTIMMGKPATPPPPIEVTGPETPENSRTLQALDRSVRRGEIDPKTAFFKTQKALEKIAAEKLLVEVELNKRKAAVELDKEARGSQKQTRFAKGKFFDQKYQETHAAELAERKEREREAMEKAKAKHRSKKKRHASKVGNSFTRGTTRTVRGLEATACAGLEEFSE